MGPESNRAAEASECAADQNQFWAFHDRVFADQVSNRSRLDDEKLVSLAGEVGLDTGRFRECLTSGRYANQVRQESLSVQSMGVRGTPAFLVNGVFISGAQPFEVFQQVIEEQLRDIEGVARPAPTNPAPISQPPASAEVDIEGVVTFPDPGRDHQEGEIDYDQVAPAGGLHNAAWQNCGVYDQPVRVENVLHSLEHGAVWIAYRPGLPANQVEILRDLVRAERMRLGEPLVILAPRPDLVAPIVATAWRVQLTLDASSDERLTQFLERYQRSPFTPEPGAPCTGGVGEPLD